MKNIVIIGAGGFAREVQWLINDINKEKNEWNIIGFIDENLDNKGLNLNGQNVIGSFIDLQEQYSGELYYVIAIADSIAKKKISEKANDIGLKPATLIHPSVIMSNLNRIGNGSIICAGSILTVNIDIGNHVIINIDSTIGHDAVIKDFSTILPSANISGNTVIEEGVSIGTGAAIIQGLRIGEYSVIGAGAVVTKNIQDRVTAVGIPAKVIK